MTDSLATATRVADPGIRALYRLENRWQAWLDVEVALARAQAELGIIPDVAAEAIAKAAHARKSGPRSASMRASPAPATSIVPLVWELASVVGDPHGGWVHWGATTQNITQTGDLLVLRQAHQLFLRQIGEILLAMADLAERGADMPMAGPHAWPARAAGDVRLQGRGLDRRTDPPCRALPPGRAAPVRGHAGRRSGHLRLARQATAAGAGQRSAGCLDFGTMAVPSRAIGDHLAENISPARPARRHLRQDRPRDLHADEDRIRRGRGTGPARHRRQLHHAAEAQSEAVPGDHRRVGRNPLPGAAGAGGDDDRA